MDQFKRVDHPPCFRDFLYYVDRFDVSPAVAEQMMQQQLSEKMFINDTYRVCVSDRHWTGTTGWPSMIHLTVMRLDQQPFRSWEDMQTIKNLFVGDEAEGIEIYPAESRLVDCGNSYHLWVFSDPNFRIPMGWKGRMVQGAGYEKAE